MVVLSDKTDYGSFAEPSSSGAVISGSESSPSVGGTVVAGSNSRRNTLSSNAGSNFESDIGIQTNLSNNNTRTRINPNVHLGKSLDLGVVGLTNRTISSTTIDSHQSADETNRGTRNRTLNANRQRNSSGNNNSLTVAGSCHSVPVCRLSPTDTVVVVNGSGKLSSGNGTTTQAYSNTSSPMSTNSGDLLYQRQPLLQECENNGWIDPDNKSVTELDSPTSDDAKRGRQGTIRIDITPDQPVVTLKRYPKEKIKTVYAFLILCCNFVLATLSLALTHERVPDRKIYKPLPDIVLDNITAQDWALSVSDILVAVSTLATAVVMLLHKHRWIVFRRAFLILACLYFMRSVTIYVTVLPVASFTYHCSPKSNSTSVIEVIRRVVQLVSGFGLSINGQHTYCGDYIYSGHTVILVTAYLFIQEYTPRKLYYLHWVSWVTSVVGVVMMLISRGHYTVDVLIAYYVATRLFWIYHTLANNPQLKVPNGQNGSSNNFLGRIWWFPLFRYMEGKVGGPLPRQFSLPWSSKEHRTRRSI